jgi:hypothetical protein
MYSIAINEVGFPYVTSCVRQQTVISEEAALGAAQDLSVGC